MLYQPNNDDPLTDAEKEEIIQNGKYLLGRLRHVFDLSYRATGTYPTASSKKIYRPDPFRGKKRIPSLTGLKIERLLLRQRQDEECFGKTDFPENIAAFFKEYALLPQLKTDSLPLQKAKEESFAIETAVPTTLPETVDRPVLRKKYLSESILDNWMRTTYQETGHYPNITDRLVLWGEAPDGTHFIVQNENTAVLSQALRRGQRGMCDANGKPLYSSLKDYRIKRGFVTTPPKNKPASEKPKKVRSRPSRPPTPYDNIIMDKASLDQMIWATYEHNGVAPTDQSPALWTKKDGKLSPADNPPITGRHLSSWLKFKKHGLVADNGEAMAVSLSNYIAKTFPEMMDRSSLQAADGRIRTAIQSLTELRSILEATERRLQRKVTLETKEIWEMDEKRGLIRRADLTGKKINTLVIKFWRMTGKTITDPSNSIIDEFLATKNIAPKRPLQEISLKNKGNSPTPN